MPSTRAIHGADPIAFVGSATVGDDVPGTAAALRDAVRLRLEDRTAAPTWADALRQFMRGIDGAGVLVMVSGVVGANTRRRLDPEEFRGFAISDSIAPLIFVNGASSKSAQMFTLAHELAHLVLGQSGVSDADVTDSGKWLLEPEARDRVERWCNRVAAEVLVPMDAFQKHADADEPLGLALPRLARRFKVSTLVVLRRLHEAGLLGAPAFWTAYGAERDRLMRMVTAGGGGDFYATQATRVGHRFAAAVLASALEGTTLYRDAMRLLGVRSVATLHEFGRRVGLDV